jgi:putative FmdB family regulatory protein
MPLYEYQCTTCRAVCEQLQKAKDKPLAKCPKCGGPVVKLVSSPAIQFKGNGWYVTDYAKKGSTAAEAGTEAKSGGKADVKAGPGEGPKDKAGPSSS